METSYKDHKFEALKLNFEYQIQNLRNMTQIDLRIISGYLTIQLFLGGWLLKNHLPELSKIVVKTGILTIDATLSLIAGVLLFHSYKRRYEVVETIKNLNYALGYSIKNIYIEDKAINAEAKFRPWFWWYLFGVLMGFVGISLIIIPA